MIIKDLNNLSTSDDPETVCIANSDGHTSFINWNFPQTITLFNGGEALGTIDYSGPELKFEGKTNESAKAFFDALIAYNSAYIKGLLSEIENLKQGKS